MARPNAKRRSLADDFLVLLAPPRVYARIRGQRYGLRVTSEPLRRGRRRTMSDGIAQFIDSMIVVQPKRRRR